MVDIQSATAENRQGKEEEERRQAETTAAKYNGLPITMGGHNNEHPQNIMSPATT